MGISIEAYIRNMGVLIRALDLASEEPVIWALDNLAASAATR